MGNAALQMLNEMPTRCLPVDAVLYEVAIDTAPYPVGRHPLMLPVSITIMLSVALYRCLS